MLCFVPATLELLAFVLFAPKIMGVTTLQAAILGAVMGAVSPAVTVPRLTKMIDDGYGVKKGIPQMLIAGASADDIYVIVLFTTLVGLEAGGDMNAMSFLRIPAEIIFGAALGALLGLGLAFYFKKIQIRDSLESHNYYGLLHASLLAGRTGSCFRSSCSYGNGNRHQQEASSGC